MLPLTPWSHRRRVGPGGVEPPPGGYRPPVLPLNHGPDRRRGRSGRSGRSPEVGRVALESTSAVLQTAARPSQLPARRGESSGAARRPPIVHAFANQTRPAGPGSRGPSEPGNRPGLQGRWPSTDRLCSPRISSRTSKSIGLTRWRSKPAGLGPPEVLVAAVAGHGDQEDLANSGRARRVLATRSRPSRAGRCRAGRPGAGRPRPARWPRGRRRRPGRRGSRA